MPECSFFAHKGLLLRLLREVVRYFFWEGALGFYVYGDGVRGGSSGGPGKAMGEADKGIDASQLQGIQGGSGSKRLHAPPRMGNAPKVIYVGWGKRDSFPQF